MSSKTHFKKLRNPAYIGSWDLADSNGNFVNRTFTISKVVKEMVHDGQGGQEECVTIHFAESKPMVANSTNLKAIAKALGSPYVEDWNGKRIELTVKRVRAFGEFHDAIRVLDKAPAAPAAPVPPAPKPKPVLTPDKAEKAREAINAGTYTLDQVRDKYEITPEAMEVLLKP